MENSIHNPLHVTEVESSEKSIVVIEDDNRYVQFGRNNSGLSIRKEERSHPISLSDSESDDKFGEDQEVTKSTYLDSSNTDAEIIQLQLDDGEFEDLDESTTMLTPTPPGPSRSPSSPTDISPRTV